ncbi:unnamed protein product [Closterium sp. NIES-53]
MAAHELRWLTYLLTDLGEAPRSPPVLYVDNKVMLGLCHEHKLEHRTKHIALRYFLARELQQRGQLRLAYVASQANTADVFTKALQPCDHQRFNTVFGLLNLWPRVSLPETLPTLRCTGKVGDASVFRFYHPTSRRVVLSQDVTFDESVPFYRLFPYRSFPPPPMPLFLAPGAPPVNPLLPQGPAPLGVFQVDPLPGTSPFQVAIGASAALGAASGGTTSGGAELGGAESEGAETGGAELAGVGTGGGEPGGAEPEGVEPGGAVSEGAESGGAEPQGAVSSGGFARACGSVRAGGAGVAAGASVTGGTAAIGPGGARAGGAGVGGPGEGGARAPGAGVGGTGAKGAGAAGVGAADPGAGGAGGTVRPQPYFVPVFQEVLGTLYSTGLPPPLLCPPPDHSQPLLQPVSPLPAPSPYTEQSGSLTERCEPVSLPVSPVRTARCAPRWRLPQVPGTHTMALRPSSVPLLVPLPAPPESSLPEVPDPASDRARAASPTISRLLAIICLDYASALVAESMPACPPSVGGECALGTDALEDRPENFECLAAAVPRFASMLLAPEGDPDAPDFPTPRSYAPTITGTYFDEVPPPGLNIVYGMWIFRGVDNFLTFSPTPKMTTLRVLLHVAAQRDYELHSLDFSTVFLQGSLHEEIWLRLPPGFIGTFPVGTQWSLRRPVYSLCQLPREWQDTMRTTFAALGFAPSTADPSLFLRTDTSLQPFYLNDLIFATADTEALTLVNSELQKRHTCTDLCKLHGYLGLQITRDRARRTITLTQSHMVQQSVELSGLYPELVGCLMYLMTCRRPDFAYPLSLLARYVAPNRHKKMHSDAAKRVLRYLCSTSDMGLVLGGRGLVVLTGHAHASWVDDSAAQWSSQGYTFSLGSGYVSWWSTRSSSVLSSTCEAEIYAEAMAAQELRWLTYLLTNLGEQPRSPPHRGQLHLAYLATRANTTDIFTKALPSGDHQRFSTVLCLVPTFPHFLTA